MLLLLPSKSGTGTEEEGQHQKCPSQQITDPLRTRHRAIFVASAGTSIQFTASKQSPDLQRKTPIFSCSWEASTGYPYPWAFQLSKSVSLFSPSMSVHILTKECKPGKEDLIASEGLESISWLGTKAAKELLRQGSLAPVWFGKSVCILRLGKEKKVPLNHLRRTNNITHQNPSQNEH